MASYDRDTDDDGLNGLNNRPWWGAKREKLGVLRFTLVIASKRSVAKMLRSILGVLPCSILRIWRLWARTKNEYPMDDFFMLTIREPWLLEKNFYVYDFRLAGRRGIDATRSSRLAARGQVDRSFEDQYKKREANLRSSIVSCMDSDCMRKLWNRLAHTFTYFASLGFWQLIVLKVQHFSKLTRCICVWRHYAHARAVWCPWCTLGWLVTHMMSQWLQGQSKVGRGSVWRVAISQPRYLARSQWQSGGCSTHDTLGSVAAPLAMR
jgi:hypothetical protein